MPTVTIPISDELATRLQAISGTLAALAVATREQWRQAVMEAHLLQIRQTATTTATASVESQVQAARTALGPLL